ncbi:MAG TPA: hypothetical protein VIV84_02320 [Burkholderiaceae bacterium]
MRLIISAVALAMAALCAPSFAASHAAAAPMGDCDKMAADKKLAGAAKDSFVKKCKADAAGGTAVTGSAACEKSAADKKLAGAAKDSHIKKCMADAGAKK